MQNEPRPTMMPLHCRGAAAVMLRKDGRAYRVLLVKRTGSYDGAWCYIAGGIENGETAWQAALREIREETNLVPDAFYSADIFEQFYEPDLESIWVAPVFVGFLFADREVVLNEEHSDFRWFTLDEAMQAVAFPGQRSVLEHVAREFIRREPCPWLKIEFNR